MIKDVLRKIGVGLAAMVALLILMAISFGLIYVIEFYFPARWVLTIAIAVAVVYLVGDKMCKEYLKAKYDNQ